MKKLFALLLASVLLLAAACQTTTTGSTRAFVPVPEGDWKAPYETTVNINAATRITNNLVFENGDDMHNNPWIRAWKDDLNIEVTWKWTVPQGPEFEQRVNLDIAAGNLPDVFKVNYTQFRQLVEQITGFRSEL